jgi:hypothetical protein
MNTPTTLRIRPNSLRFCTLLLALMGLLFFGAASSQAEETYFNILNPKTGATEKSWKIENFAWETASVNQPVSAFNMTGRLTPFCVILEEATATGSPIAAAAITFYKKGKPYLTYKFTHLQVTNFDTAGNGSDTPTASASLTFQHVSIIYQP